MKEILWHTKKTILREGNEAVSFSVLRNIVIVELRDEMQFFRFSDIIAKQIDECEDFEVLCYELTQLPQFEKDLYLILDITGKVYSDDDDDDDDEMVDEELEDEISSFGSALHGND